LKTNTAITVFHKSINPTTRSEAWESSQIVSVWWEDRKAANVIRSGLLEADSVAVYLPYTEQMPDIKPGDVIVKGLVMEEISSSFTISDLKRAYSSVVTVRSVDKMEYGSQALWHWEVGAA
jgi:hypothetical protein